MNNLYCPYCNEEVDIDTSDMYEDDQVYKVECEHCNKKFGLRVSMSWNYYEEKVDCWNDEQHKWKNRIMVPVEYAVGKQMCQECGEEREISEEEWKKIDADIEHPENWRNHES